MTKLKTRRKTNRKSYQKKTRQKKTRQKKTRQKKSNISRNKSRRGGCWSLDTVKNAFKGTVAGPATEVVSSTDVQTNTLCGKIIQLINKSGINDLNIDTLDDTYTVIYTTNNNILIWQAATQNLARYDCNNTSLKLSNFDFNTEDIKHSIASEKSHGKFIVSKRIFDYKKLNIDDFLTQVIKDYAQDDESTDRRSSFSEIINDDEKTDKRIFGDNN